MFLVLALVASFLVTGCASTPTTVEWRAYIEEAEGTPEWNYMKHAADEIFARSDGEVKITIYPEESLGYEAAQLIDVVGQGLIELAVLRSAHGSGQAPMLNLGDLPFLQDNAEQAPTVTEAIFPYYDEALEPFGVHALSMWKSAPTGVTSKVNINTLEAWQGVALRAWSPTLQDLSNLLGAKPVQMPYSEAFSALSTGIIDGVYWTPSSALSVKTFDAGCTYYDQWNIFTMTNMMIGSDMAMQKLSSKGRKAVEEVWIELSPEVWENEYWSFEADYKGLQAEGVEIVLVDPAEIAKVRAKSSVVWDEWLNRSGAEGLKALNDTLKALGRANYR
jgi:TRAP-type C4-dicarboxylate transport system substrate-binding protein